MTWCGTWKNQFGSIVVIASEDEGRIEGTFRTALEDSAFYGSDVPILGVCRGPCINFASVGTWAAGDMIVSYTGLRRDGKMESVWFYAADGSLVASAESELAVVGVLAAALYDPVWTSTVLGPRDFLVATAGSSPWSPGERRHGSWLSGSWRPPWTVPPLKQIPARRDVHHCRAGWKSRGDGFAAAPRSLWSRASQIRRTPPHIAR